MSSRLRLRSTKPCQWEFPCPRSKDARSSALREVWRALICQHQEPAIKFPASKAREEQQCIDSSSTVRKSSFSRREMPTTSPYSETMRAKIIEYGYVLVLVDNEPKFGHHEPQSTRYPNNYFLPLFFLVCSPRSLRHVHSFAPSKTLFRIMKHSIVSLVKKAHLSSGRKGVVWAGILDKSSAWLAGYSVSSAGSLGLTDRL